MGDKVTIITVSDFGRTMTSNGHGTDHAWSGNYILAGGDDAGGQIHGSYPDDLSEDGKTNIGRGRLIPTLGWESAWNALGQWMGVPEENMDAVLPNRKNFPDDRL